MPIHLHIAYGYFSDTTAEVRSCNIMWPAKTKYLLSGTLQKNVPSLAIGVYTGLEGSPFRMNLGFGCIPSPVMACVEGDHFRCFLLPTEWDVADLVGSH